KVRGRMIGFCFSGEGARGSIQSGIALALHLKGINADFVVGTSSGSINAAAYSYLGPIETAKMWQGINSIFDILSINWNFLWNTGLFNQNPLSQRVNKIVKNKPICERMVLTINVETGEQKYVSNKSPDFVEGVLKSVAIPGLVTDRNNWIDAGVCKMV